MTVQECTEWWKQNRDRWTIPFPEDKAQYLKWLKDEAYSGIDVWALGATIVTISRVEGKESIDLLVQMLGHPKKVANIMSLAQLQKLFGDQLPEAYSLKVGTDNWETYSDLHDLGKEEQVRKAIAKTNEKINNAEYAKQAAKEIANW